MSDVTEEKAFTVIEEDMPFDPTFDDTWAVNEAPAVVFEAAMHQVERRRDRPDEAGGVVYLTDVTLRDGQQQRTDEVTEFERLDVFDALVGTGVDCIEIGHLGNGNGDQQLAREVVRRVAEMEGSDERYAKVRLQVLFGSQTRLIQEGIGVLSEAFQESYGEQWQEVMADKVVVHVYDRLDENLRKPSSEPYSSRDSAERIARASQYALAAGFKHFSVSGEGATAVPPEEAIQFHRTINDWLLAHGAERVNVNLANTYGFSPAAEWNMGSLAFFDAAVKLGYDDRVTTSIHTHNDVNSASDFAMAAIVAGFDRVEGTLTGMGERAGNVSTIDVVARILEQARHEIVSEERGARQSRIAGWCGDLSMRRTISLDANVAANLNNWWSAGEIVSDMFGPDAAYRYQRTVLGNPYVHDNGSGPHDQLMGAAVRHPRMYPPDMTYQWGLTTAYAMGDPIALPLAIGDPTAVARVTVGNHAGGGSTERIRSGAILGVRADEIEIEAAADRFMSRSKDVVGRAIDGVVVRVA